MKRLLRFYISYFIYWLLVFETARLLFVIFNFPKAGMEYSWYDFILVFFYGLKHDMSVAGYLMVLPGIIIVLNSFLKRNFKKYFFYAYTLIFLILVSVISVADLKLYQYWGFKIDIQPFLYLKTPGEAMASVTFWDMMFHIALIVLMIWGLFKMYRKWVHPLLSDHSINFTRVPLSFLFLTAFLMLPIRGGVGVTPMNLAKVYFHKQMFFNHSAINPCWNLIRSFSDKKKLSSKFTFFPEEEAAERFHSLYPDDTTGDTLLSVSKPNIVLIILESFTSKIIQQEFYGKEVTPNVNRLIHEGIYFDRFYASGDRSDKGLVSILSGYPAQPVSSIIAYPNKTQKLPSLFKDVKDAGYNTGFYYGGDLAFANMQSYFYNMQVEKIVSKKDFPAEDYNAKWGVHDHILLERFLDDITKQKEPFLQVLFTLSSHEPFEVPWETAFEGAGEEIQFLNAAHYVDKALGIFMQKLKNTPLWDRTLVIFVADHGHRLPGNSQNHVEEKFRIPMLWTGGCLLKKDTTISKIVSQTDIPKTLATLLNISGEHYRFSKNVLSSQSRSFAFYTYNNGFGWVTDNSSLIYDNHTRNILENHGTDKGILDLGKSYLQVLTEDFTSK